MNNKINADKKELLYSDLTYKVRGAIFTVYNELGYGHKESLYQKALLKEFQLQEIPAKREVPLKISYKGEHVGNYRPDFILGDKVILELKAVEFMPKTYETQLLQYLKATGYALGLLVNFGSSALYIKRLINSHPRKSKQISENRVPPKVAERG